MVAKNYMRKIICYLCGGFAAFNLMVIFPAFMSGAPADWIGWRFLFVLIFGSICFFLAKKKTKTEEPIIVASGNKKQKDECKIQEKKKEDNVQNEQSSLFASSTTEAMSKTLFKIASEAISEVIETSGGLNQRGLCEAIMFNSSIILNDPIFKQKSYYKTVSDDYLILLYYLTKRQRTDLEKNELIDFINDRLEFYSAEYDKLVGENQYTPTWVYSTFYITPLEDEPKPCLDVLQVMTFQVGLTRMACKVHELLLNKM